MLYSRLALLPAIFALSGFMSPAGFDALKTVIAAGADDGGERTQTVQAVVAASDADAPPVTTSKVTAPLRLKRSADGLFYVHASVGGKRVRFVVDTGSSVMVLTRRDAETLGVARSANHRGSIIRTANGNASMAWTTLDRVSIGDRHVKNVRAAVVNEGLPVSLMGQNMLSELGSIRIQGDRLEFE